jgi:PBP1b-binding outer membrane lipoprotein LpoB
MRAVVPFTMPVLALALVLGGCKREPNFDERYDTASKAIVDKAKAIDAQIAATGAPPAEADTEDGTSRP